MSNAQLDTATVSLTRDETVSRIKQALRRRSGKAWSVTSGRGTAWGWLCIDAPPSRRTVHCHRKAGAVTDRPEDYEMVNTGEPGGYMTDADRTLLGHLLGLDGQVHPQGVSIPSGGDYYAEYVDRAEGRVPSRLGQRYWD